MRRIRGDTARAVALLALHVAILVLFVATPLQESVNQETVKAFVRRTDWYGPLVLFGLCAITPLFLVPRWVLAFAAGMLYGTLLGGALANVGSAVGAIVGMLFARYMVRAFVMRRLGRHQDAFDRMTDHYGVRVLVAIRAVPFSNFVVTNSLAGASKIRILPYAVASFVGMIPSSFMYAFMGQVAKEPRRELLALFGIIFVAFSVLALTLGRRLLRRWSEPSEDAGDASAEANGTRLPPPTSPPTSRSQG